MNERIIITKPGEVVIENTPMPSPGPGEALLRVLYGGICGSDLGTYRGTFVYVEYPRVPGHELAVEVVEAPSGSGLRPGTLATVNPYFNCGECYPCRSGRVNCCTGNQTLGCQRDGGFARYITMPAERVYPAQDLDPKQIVLIEPFCISYHGVKRACIQPGEQVLVVGAGTIGILAMLAVKQAGGIPYVADVAPDKLTKATALGAAGTFLNTSPEALREWTASTTNGNGFPVTVEAVGLAATFQNCIDSVAFSGRVVLIGVSKQTLDFDFTVIQKKELAVYGSRNAVKTDFTEVIDIIRAGGLPADSVVTDVYPFSRAADAFRDFSDHAGEKLKVILDFTAESEIMNQHIVLTQNDNVAIALHPLAAGTVITVPDGSVTLGEAIPQGHKVALRPISAGENIIKYGLPIGHASRDIAAGHWVHTQNTKTNLSGEVDYTYTPAPAVAQAKTDIPTFMGYRRPNGKVGIRNEVWIIPTVGCVNHLAEALAKQANAMRPDGVEAVVAYPHNYGCSQMGDDHESTRIILADLARHPNAAAVLVIGLGCENNIMSSFLELVRSDPTYNTNLDSMIAQEEEDEEAVGLGKLERLMETAASFRREPIPVTELCIGLKCGGSDGLSGVTANPLLGRFADWLADRGGKVVLTEVPEMFGAEQPLLNRAIDKHVFDKGVDMINHWKRFYAGHNQPIYENPSPGNKDGGITTLEDKSLGCTQKAGSRPVVDVLEYGGVVTRPGVSLLSGPGNDIVAVTALAAAGAHLVMFTTGRGTPLGGPVPVLKVSTNSALAAKKPHWIDWNAGSLVDGETMEALLDRYTARVLEIASGSRTRSEEKGLRDFAIFKTGVTL